MASQPETPGLVKYDAACQAIAAAKSVDEAKELHDKAEAIRAYARQAKNKTLELDAAEIRIRAERRLGELLEPSKEKRGGSKSRKGTLKVTGISKRTSARAQKLAAVPAEVFESKLGELRRRVEAEGARVTTDLLKVGQSEQEKHTAPPDTARIELLLPLGEFEAWVTAAKSEGLEIERWIRQRVNDSLKASEAKASQSHGDVYGKPSTKLDSVMRRTVTASVDAAKSLINPPVSVMELSTSNPNERLEFVPPQTVKRVTIEVPAKVNHGKFGRMTSGETLEARAAREERIKTFKDW